MPTYLQTIATQATWKKVTRTRLQRKSRASSAPQPTRLKRCSLYFESKKLSVSILCHTFHTFTLALTAAARCMSECSMQTMDDCDSLLVTEAITKRLSEYTFRPSSRGSLTGVQTCVTGAFSDWYPTDCHQPSSNYLPIGWGRHTFPWQPVVARWLQMAPYSRSAWLGLNHLTQHCHHDCHHGQNSRHIVSSHISAKPQIPALQYQF